MLRILLNAYIFLFLFIFGPEVVAKSLPMKKVQTVETVWVPMTQDEISESEDVIEAVEIPEGQQGAVPLFKEAMSDEVSAIDDVVAEAEESVIVAKEIPEGGVQVQTPPDGQRPIIQVIYQGTKPKKEVAKIVPKPVPPPVVDQTEPQPVVSEPVFVPKKPKRTKKKPGDIYNFYFKS